MLYIFDSMVNGEWIAMPYIEADSLEEAEVVAGFWADFCLQTKGMPDVENIRIIGVLEGIIPFDSRASLFEPVLIINIKMFQND